MLNRSVTVLSWDSVSSGVNQLNCHPNDNEYTEEEFPFIRGDRKVIIGYANKVLDEYELDDIGDPCFEHRESSWTASTATLEFCSSRGHIATMIFIWH